MSTRTPRGSLCPSVLAICAAVTILNAGCGLGMQLTSTGPQTLRRAQGERADLGCTFTPGPLDTGELDIEWSMVSPDTTQKDQLLVSYAGGSKYIHGNSALTEGLAFAAGDPSLGDASLSIASLSPTHSATYQCKVKKSPGVDMRKLSLVVLVKPVAPKCWVEGEAAVGEPVSLRCDSALGSRPLTYTWRRETGGPIPAAATQNGATGELAIGNHSQSFAGVYQCEVTNAVGAERCRINLRAVKPANRAGVIIGTVVGCLLLLIIVLLLIFLFVYKWNARPRYDKEMANEIREDVPAPESRPASRMVGSSLRHGGVYSPVPRSLPSQSDRGHASPSHPSQSDRGHASTSPNSTDSAAKYDSRYGYAV